MRLLPRPVAVAIAVVALLGGVGLPAGSADAAVKATRVSGWSGRSLVATQGQQVRLRVAVRPARNSVRRTVVLQRRTSGAGGWRNVSTAHTNTHGVAMLQLPTARSFNGAVRLWVRATHKARAVATPSRRLVVRTAAVGSAATSAAVPATTSTEREVVRLVNLARASARTCGSQQFGAARPLRLDDRLSKAGRDHALDMGTKGYFSHTSTDGRTFVDRVHAAGYASPSAENIAAGYATPADVVQGWLASAGHCANIMSTDSVDVGVGFADVPGSPYGTYWVQDFGRG
jgi:uncharacterized protein YkwD